MSIYFYRSFATELTKIAMVDSEIRELHADRKGKEYLVGGQLPSNSPVETGYVPKLASRKIGPPSMGKLQNPSTADEGGTYHGVRDTALAGLGGALTGSGIVKLHEAIKGKGYKATGKHHAIAAGLGATVALADRAFRHKDTIKSLLPFGKAKEAMMGSGTFTPARALQRDKKVGHFEDERNHVSAKPKLPLV